MSIVAWAVIASMVLLSVTGLLAGYEQSRLFRRLRDQHSGVWLAIGGPSAWHQLVPLPATYNFLIQRKYLEVPDPMLHNLADRVRRIWFASFWQVMVLALLCLALAVGSKYGAVV